MPLRPLTDGRLDPRSSTMARTALLAAALLLPLAAAVSVGESFAGEATYYGAGNDASSHCKGNGYSTGPGGIVTVALNSPQMQGGKDWCAVGGRGAWRAWGVVVRGDVPRLTRPSSRSQPQPQP